MTATQTRWTARATNPRLPLWVRVSCYAEAHADPTGLCKLKAEQLRDDLDPTLHPSQISRAIATGIKYGWLHPTSHNRRLVLQPQEVS